MEVIENGDGKSWIRFNENTRNAFGSDFASCTFHFVISNNPYLECNHMLRFEVEMQISTISSLFESLTENKTLSFFKPYFH